MANGDRIRMAGVACALGGAFWLIALMAAVFFHDAIYGSAAVYRTWVGLLIVVHSLLLVGIVGLAGSGVAGPTWLGRIGLGIAMIARVSFLLGEVRSFVQGSDDDLFVPLGALLTGIGMTFVGIAVLRARAWDGWQRFLPLLVGIYPFLAMFPLFAIMGTPPVFNIALWGVLWLLLGMALQARAGLAGEAQRMATASASL